MKKVFSLALVLISTIGLAQTVNSAHVSQSHKLGSSNEIDVTYHIVVGDGDSSFSSSDFQSMISCPSTSASVAISGITKTAERKLTFDCSDSIYLWEMEFSVSLDLNAAIFSSLSNCCNLRIDFSAASRSGSINTFSPSMTNIYVYTEFENCGTNINSESPTVGGRKYFLSCQNQNTYQSPAITDNGENDSLSFKLVTPLASSTTSVSYNVGREATLPTNAYFPGSLSHPFTNPNASPPVGYHFSETTGQITFTPTSLDTGAMVYEISEWRKTSSGRVLVGKSVMEFGFAISACSDNHSPRIDGPSNYEVCAGSKICFDLVTDDVVFIPPPPATPPSPDSVTLEVISVFAGDSFKLLDSTARLQRGRFCWTPPRDVSGMFYLVVAAKDNACSIPAIAEKTIGLLVKRRPIGVTTLSQLDDSSYVLDLLDSNSNPLENMTYLRRIFDENWNVIDDPNIASLKRDLIESRISKDTFTAKVTGTYIVRTEVDIPGDNCPTSYNDTIHFQVVSTPSHVRKQITLYPNPASSEVFLSEMLESCIVFSYSGKRISEIKNAKRIDVSSLAPGMYYISGSNNDVLYQGWFIVN